MFDFNAANKLLETPNTSELPNTSITLDQAVDQLRSSINIEPLVAQAEGYEIDTVEHATQALSMALQARKLATAIQTSKKEITRPQLDFQKAVNKLAGDYLDKLERIENNLKGKIENWIDSNTDYAYSSGLDSIQVPDGSLKRVNRWEFSVTDPDAIPREFMCANFDAIQKCIDGGIRNIPGIEISLKQEIKLRVKN